MNPSTPSCVGVDAIVSSPCFPSHPGRNLVRHRFLLLTPALRLPLSSPPSRPPTPMSSRSKKPDEQGGGREKQKIKFGVPGSHCLMDLRIGDNIQGWAPAQAHRLKQCACLAFRASILTYTRWQMRSGMGDASNSLSTICTDACSFATISVCTSPITAA